MMENDLLIPPTELVDVDRLTVEKLLGVQDDLPLAPSGADQLVIRRFKWITMGAYFGRVVVLMKF